MDYFGQRDHSRHETKYTAGRNVCAEFEKKSVNDCDYQSVLDTCMTCVQTPLKTCSGDQDRYPYHDRRSGPYRDDHLNDLFFLYDLLTTGNAQINDPFRGTLSFLLITLS